MHPHTRPCSRCPPFPLPRGQLAEALGAEVHCVAAGHAECLWLDGVALMVGAALAVFRDSRV